MKKQILFSSFVLSALVLSSGIWNNLSQAAALQPDPGSSLSPNLQMHAYEFLDLVPVGHMAPDFTAKTAYKKPFRLASLKGHKNAVIIFYQGSFCPVCGKQLENFQANLDKFKTLDTEIIAVSADDATHAMQSIAEHGLQFTVIPDTDKSVIKKFGVSNVGKEGLAWPAMYIIDKTSKVRLSFAKDDGHRMHSDEVLPILNQIAGKAKKP